MKFHQHVYGSVSVGLKGDMPGYQVAALSPELERAPELVDALNRLSFFKRSSDGATARVSFFRPVAGYVAIGRSCMAEDLTGSVGSFAHNLVCKEEDFLASDLAVVAILRSFRFLAREADLPGERALP